ncbi:hypothetical protein HIM_10020 [Hirsutella minnesotensis 3608]|uniref:Uncharacterized protein n=1 Tax=Hirsutella minnesotensis 3608 TaxID=1043627 RepID=A0A0F7ZGB3_9HYPO|nr:hypothetical protein HIM_10020 [Hirsutella minnesotensis 3608]
MSKERKRSPARTRSTRSTTRANALRPQSAEKSKLKGRIKRTDKQSIQEKIRKRSKTCIKKTEELFDETGTRSFFCYLDPITRQWDGIVKFPPGENLPTDLLGEVEALRKRGPRPRRRGRQPRRAQQSSDVDAAFNGPANQMWQVPSDNESDNTSGTWTPEDSSGSEVDDLISDAPSKEQPEEDHGMDDLASPARKKCEMQMPSDTEPGVLGAPRPGVGASTAKLATMSSLPLSLSTPSNFGPGDVTHGDMMVANAGSVSANVMMPQHGTPSYGDMLSGICYDYMPDTMDGLLQQGADYHAFNFDSMTGNWLNDLTQATVPPSAHNNAFDVPPVNAAAGQVGTTSTMAAMAAQPNAPALVENVTPAQDPGVSHSLTDVNTQQEGTASKFGSFEAPPSKPDERKQSSNMSGAEILSKRIQGADRRRLYEALTQLRLKTGPASASTAMGSGSGESPAEAAETAAGFARLLTPQRRKELKILLGQVCDKVEHLKI